MTTLSHFFTCGLTGDKLAVIIRDGEKFCVTEAEGWEVETQSQARHEAYMLRLERGE